jgi:plasmid stabilization system protein ParE
MVKWTVHARTQLHLIHDHIAQDSPLYAKRIVGEIVHKTIILEQTPKIGRKVSELNEEAVREIPVYNFCILYEIKEAHVDILAVIHKRQDLRTEQIPR